MSISKKGFCVLAVWAITGLAGATQRLVPGQFQYIQDAINYAASGDTVSVWGPQGVPPPYTYYGGMRDASPISVLNRVNGSTGSLLTTLSSRPT